MIGRAQGIKKLVGALQSRGVAVYLISGGFRELTMPIARELGVPADNVFANRMNWQARLICLQHHSAGRLGGEVRICGLRVRHRIDAGFRDRPPPTAQNWQVRSQSAASGQ